MNHTMRTPSRIRAVLGLVTAAALLSLSACGGGGGADADPSSSASASPSESDSASAPAEAGAPPGLEGIPDVVAEVNGEEVTKEEFIPIYTSTFEQAAAQAQAGGAAPDVEALKKQTVEDLVSTELLHQEAVARGIEVAEEDIDAELASLAEQNQLGSAEELLAAIKQRGVSEEQARSQVETQLLVEALVVDEQGPVQPSEKDLHAVYDQAKAQQAQSGQAGGQKIPPFAEVHDQLEEQAMQQTIGEVAGALAADLRKDAEITINL